MGWRDEWVSGGSIERPVADRGRLAGCWGNARLVSPLLIAHRTYVHQVENTKCPRQNSTKLWQLYSPFPRMAPSGPLRTINSTCAPPVFLSPNLPILISPQPAVLQLLQARCVLRGAITGHLGPYFPGLFESSHYRRRQYRETRNFGLYR